MIIKLPSEDMEEFRDQHEEELEEGEVREDDESLWTLQQGKVETSATFPQVSPKRQSYLLLIYYYLLLLLMML